MRRKDREIINREEVLDVLSKCDTVRIGVYGKEFPYVVPVSFGLSVRDNVPIVYFHCAKQGLKVDLLKENPNVCLEGDIFHGIVQTAHGITTRYESVIGFGTCTFVEEPAEVIYGMQSILDHYGYSDYPLNHCSSLNHMLLGKIVLEKMTGKRNIQQE